MTENNSKRGRSARKKGANGELELCRELKLRGFENVTRGYVFLHQSDLVGLKGIHIECKRVEKLNIDNAMAQAVEESVKRQDGVPTVFHRKNRKEWLVTMRLDDWVNLYKKGEGYGF